MGIWESITEDMFDNLYFHIVESGPYMMFKQASVIPSFWPM